MTEFERLVQDRLRGFGFTDDALTDAERERVQDAYEQAAEATAKMICQMRPYSES